MEGIATDAHHADLGSGLVLVWGFVGSVKASTRVATEVSIL